MQKGKFVKTFSAKQHLLRYNLLPFLNAKDMLNLAMTAKVILLLIDPNRGANRHCKSTTSKHSPKHILNSHGPPQKNQNISLHFMYILSIQRAWEGVLDERGKDSGE